MTDTLTVATHFEDLSQFSTGMVDRVDEDRLILYGPVAYAEGETVSFAVLLLDGSAALEGQARILATVDGGEERDPSARYDIYLDGLELGGMAQAVYERILLARSSIASGEPPTGEIDVSELEGMEAAAGVAPGAPVEEPAADLGLDAGAAEAGAESWDAAAAPEEDFGGESTVVAADPQALADAYEAERELPAEADVEVDAGVVAEAALVEAGDWAEPMAEEAAPEAPAEEAGDWAEPMVEAEPMAEEAAPEAPAEEAGDWAEPMVEAAPEAPAEAAPEAPAEEADDWAEPMEAAEAGDWAEAVESVEDDYVPVDAEGLAVDVGAELAADGPDVGTAAALAGEASIPPPAPEDPGGFQLPVVASGVLTRPSREPAWWPAPAERPEAREVSGYFAYEGELPTPASPPHPELDPSDRVGPAPRPAVEDAAVEDAAVEDAAVDDAAVDDAAVEDAAIEEVAVDDAAVEEVAEATCAADVEAEQDAGVEIEEVEATREVDLAQDATRQVEMPETEAAVDIDMAEETEGELVEAAAPEADIEFEDFDAVEIQEPVEER